MCKSKMAKVRGTVGKSQDKSNTIGSKKLSPVKTKKDSRTKSTDKISSTPKINKTSKTAISKTNKKTVTKILKKKVKEVGWLKGLLNSSEHTKTKSSLKSGIKNYNPSASSPLTMRFENGVEYAMFPWQKQRCWGFVKMSPSAFKVPSRSQSVVHMTVLFGKVQLLAGKTTTNFDCGSMIKIPKGVQYGLKNTTTKETFIRFQSIID